ncbi:MAG: hypothetical protein K6E77_08420, partial [Lachnospiraceae bacterium]|nr:hypothetical protein [Lachnospiraceae bacterium]
FQHGRIISGIFLLPLCQSVINLSFEHKLPPFASIIALQAVFYNTFILFWSGFLQHSFLSSMQFFTVFKFKTTMIQNENTKGFGIPNPFVYS